jgi:hypothetical protein
MTATREPSTVSLYCCYVVCFWPAASSSRRNSISQPFSLAIRAKVYAVSAKS